jgi:hypothetical protein
MLVVALYVAYVTCKLLVAPSTVQQQQQCSLTPFHCHCTHTMYIYHCDNSVLESEHQAATFALIKAIVAQCVMLPAVYDLMDDLCSLAVTSHRAPLRATCAQIFLQYLVSYPLGQKRLEQHLRQVLEGTAYRHEVHTVCF